MVVLLNTIGAREALYAYVNSIERLATVVSTIRRIDREQHRRVATDAGKRLCKVAGRPRRESGLCGAKKLRSDGSVAL